MTKNEPPFAAQSLLSAGLISSRIGIKPSMVERLAEKMQLPVVRLNEIVYLDERDVDYIKAWLETADAAKRAELGAGATKQKESGR